MTEYSCRAVANTRTTHWILKSNQFATLWPLLVIVIIPLFCFSFRPDPVPEPVV